MPLTYQGGPTVPAITACDLMTRLYIYAADSMRGREAGTPDAIRATAYIEREVKRLGLHPAGDNGTFFQAMPVTARVMTQASSISRRRKDIPPRRPTSAPRAARTGRQRVTSFSAARSVTPSTRSARTMCVARSS